MKKLLFTLALCILIILSITFSIATMSSTSYPGPNTKIGDADLDGDVDNDDAKYIAENSVGLNSIIGSKCHVDVNQDGRVDVKDALIVAQIAEGILPERGTCEYSSSLEPNDHTLIGDADLDGDVDDDDAELIARYAVGLLPLTKNICNIDLNNDGIVTVLDSLIAAQIAEGIKPQLGTCEDREDDDNGDSDGKLTQDDLEIDRIIVDDEISQTGDTLIVSVDIDNNARRELNNAIVRVSIPELGITRSKRVNIDNRDDKIATINLDLDDAPKGDYELRIEISDDNSKFQRIKHREFTII